MAISGSIQGIRSVEIASTLLKVLARHKGPMALGKLAAGAGMTPSKARRYLVSLCRSELAAQDPETGLYAPGALAFELSRASLPRILPLALSVMTGFRDEVNETVSLVVWGPKGPTVLHYEESDQPVRLNTSVGSVLPLVKSASGQIFAAFLPWERVWPLLLRELKEGKGPRDIRTAGGIERLVREIRRRGVTRADGTLLPGVSALGAPVFDRNGELAAGLVVIGHKGAIDVRLNGRPASALVHAAKVLSSRMGAEGVAGNSIERSRQRHGAMAKPAITKPAMASPPKKRVRPPADDH